MRALTLLFWLAGLTLIAALLSWVDAREVVRFVSTIGWGFAAVLGVRVVLLYVDSHSWRWLLQPQIRPSLHMAAFQRWIGEAVTVLLPFASIGGELVRVRLAIRYGIAGAPAFASILMDAAVAVVSQLLFVGLGVALYAEFATKSESLSQPILLGCAALLLAAGAFWMAIRGGVLGRFARLMKGMLAGDRVAWLAEALDSVDQHIGVIVANRSAFVRAVAWRLLGWLLGAAEVWLILHLLGHPISVGEALMLDALTGAVRTAFFFVPAGLGVQEGALLLLGGVVGVSGETMLAVAVIKRAREVVFSVPGLIAWQVVETRTAGR